MSDRYNKRLYEVMEDNIANPKYPLHMPGHKRRFWELNFEDFDFTEIYGLDNLQNPEECIEETLKAIARLFKSDESLILVNGSTVGILASIMGSLVEREAIIVGRNCHQSVINAVTMAKCYHSFVYPKISRGIVIGFSLEDIENSFKQNKNVKALLLTSPTYEGIVLDIKKISELCKKYKVILIIDEAHGAYFIDQNLPTSAIELGADVVIQSLHKTLPAPTQTALLHINKGCNTKDNIKRYLNMLQTTSPSYFFMYTIDKLVENIEKGNFNGMFNRHYNRISSFRVKCKELKKLGLLELVDSEFIKINNVFDIDDYKLTFLVKGSKGIEVSKILRSEYKIELEMATPGHFIAMTSIADSDEIFEKFYIALVEISHKFREQIYNNKEINTDLNIKRESVKLSSLNLQRGKLVKLDKCVDMICLKNITPYPPCVPYIVVGERFTEEDVLNIRGFKESEVSLLGIEIKDNDIYVYVES